MVHRVPGALPLAVRLFERSQMFDSIDLFKVVFVTLFLYFNVASDGSFPLPSRATRGGTPRSVSYSLRRGQIQTLGVERERGNDQMVYEIFDRITPIMKARLSARGRRGWELPKRSSWMCGAHN